MSASWAKGPDGVHVCTVAGQVVGRAWKGTVAGRFPGREKPCWWAETAGEERKYPYRTLGTAKQDVEAGARRIMRKAAR